MTLEALTDEIRPVPYAGMRLEHFSNAPVLSVHTVAQVQEPDRKPRGFWVSVRGTDDWYEWCTAENFGIGAIRHTVTLTPCARILHLNRPVDLDCFHSEYSQEFSSGPRNQLINWQRVSEEYQGILISPYQWSRRFDTAVSHWYYGWDCASGCIWDASAVECAAEVADGAIND